MIPWRSFEAKSQQDCTSTLPVPLEECYLQTVQHGPSIAAAMFFEPSMLEVAHERRFVVTQQGGDGAGFEVEHAKRISACLTALERHFRHFASDRRHEPRYFPSVDHVGIWARDQPSDTPLQLEMVQDEQASPSHGLGHQHIELQRALTQAVSIDLPQTSAVPSLIDIEDSEGSDNIDEALLRSSVLANAARARCSTLSSSKAARAERQTRKRKQRFSQKDESRVSRLRMDGTVEVTSKYWVPTAAHTYRASTESSVLSLYTPADSIFDFENHMAGRVSISEVTAHIGSSPVIDTG